MRPDSPAYGKWLGIELTMYEPTQVLVPPNCGHGFLSLLDNSIVVYQQSGTYDTKVERSVNYRSLGIKWPKINTEYIVSEKDMTAPHFA